MGKINCISVLSSFMRLREEIGFSKDVAMPYINSWLEILAQSKQTTFRIHNNDNEGTVIKVKCEKAFEEIFDDRLLELRNGELKYK